MGDLTKDPVLPLDMKKPRCSEAFKIVGGGKGVRRALRALFPLRRLRRLARCAANARAFASLRAPNGVRTPRSLLGYEKAPP